MTAMLASGEVPRARVNISRVSMGRPFTWLYRGWQDMRRHWSASLGLGALIVAIGWTVLIFCGTHPYYVAAALSGFLLLAPIISVGPSEMSRRYETGQRATFDDALDAFARRSGSLFAFGALLALIAIFWFALSGVMLESVFHIQAPSMSETMYRGFVERMNQSQVEAYCAVGGVLAVFVFVLSVVTVPMIVDKDAGLGQAIGTSVRAVFSNLPAMIVWSALILVLTVVGYAPFLCGLLIIGPLLGHATWHAYRDLVQ